MWGGCEVGGVFKFDIYLADFGYTTYHHTWWFTCQTYTRSGMAVADWIGRHGRKYGEHLHYLGTR